MGKNPSTFGFREILASKKRLWISPRNRWLCLQKDGNTFTDLDKPQKQFPALHSYTIEAYKNNPLSPYHICNQNFEYTYLTRASQLDILKLWFVLIMLQLQAASLYTTLMFEMLYDEQWCSKTALTGIPSSGVSVGCTPLARTTAPHSRN